MKPSIAIVTGVGRHAGIGKAICIALAKQGIDVFFSYWSAYDQSMPWYVKENEPEEIQTEIKSLGVKCEKLELDLSSDQSTKILLEACKNKLGEPRILINNATYSTSTTIDDLTGSELDKHYLVNLKATTLLITQFTKEFGFNDGGSIVNMISGQELGEMHQEIAYAITKGAIKTLTQTISQELMSKGITINAVNPGPNDTGWIDEYFKKELVQRFPSGRIGRPEDTANLVAFLVSEHGSWITGQVINSEGGFKR